MHVTYICESSRNGSTLQRAAGDAKTLPLGCKFDQCGWLQELRERSHIEALVVVQKCMRALGTSLV